MDKKKREDTNRQKSPALTHNPFGQLAGNREALPTGPTPKTDEPAPVASSPQTKIMRGRLVLRRETKRRGGKAVVIVSGLSALAGFDDRAILELAQKLKKQLGCGGTVEAQEIVLQGDRAAQVAELLRGLGFRVEGVTS